MTFGDYPSHWLPRRSLSRCEKLPEPVVKYGEKIPVYIRKKPLYPVDPRLAVVNGRDVLIKHVNRLFEKMQKASSEEEKVKKRKRIIEILGDEPYLGSCFALLERKEENVNVLTVREREVEKLKEALFLLEMQAEGKTETFYVDGQVEIRAFNEREYKQHTDAIGYALNAMQTNNPAPTQAKPGWRGKIGRIFNKKSS
ncbi:hypothetical protein [Parachlamydia sp. AcF125]|uniref:hypothetical protein n=1 Tax=Parachlamydia sp. AcF125 TaxID=2795736 RepID=UPI001BC9D8E5|nr:hypothetical protein [Parachlamydia sp. AcF125]MBS4167958.1 hypothetical protein [Parachlamydia sp. AcF125]